MKLKLAALVTGALLATGAHAQFDVGYELGSARLGIQDNEIKTRINHNFKVGFQDKNNGLGAEAVYVYTPKAKFGSEIARFEQKSVGAKLLAKTEIPIASRFSGVLKGGLGYQHSHIKSTNKTLKRSEYFPAVAIGVSFKANEQFKVGVNLNHDGRNHYKFKENTYLTAGFDYAFDAGKFI